MLREAAEMKDPHPTSVHDAVSPARGSDRAPSIKGPQKVVTVVVRGHFVDDQLPARQASSSVIDIELVGVTGQVFGFGLDNRTARDGSAPNLAALGRVRTIAVGR